MALKHKLSCVNPKPCGSKSSEAQLCEARNWVHSLGGEGRGRGIEAQAKLCEAQALREQVVRGPVLRGQKLGPFLRGEGVALKNKLSCVNPKPCGSKSSEAQLCEARN